MRLPSDGSRTLAKKSFLLFFTLQVAAKTPSCGLSGSQKGAQVGST